MPIGQLWVVFSLSFLMSLSGALMPGPLLTYTIARTLGTPRGGWLIGGRVIAGHAALEAALACGLVLGVVEFLRAPLASKIIGVVGGALLLYMGTGLLRETFRGAAASSVQDRPGGPVSRLNPTAAGVLVSMSNPYWWIWWVTIGSAFLVRFDISFARWQALVAFFLGHEAGDLGWYLSISTVFHLGRRGIPRGVTTGIMAACGVGIIGFAAYLGISPFLTR